MSLKTVFSLSSQIHYVSAKIRYFLFKFVKFHAKNQYHTNREANEGDIGFSSEIHSLFQVVFTRQAVNFS